MAGVMGLEPTAFAVTGRRCNQLNYTPAFMGHNNERTLKLAIESGPVNRFQDFGVLNFNFKVGAAPVRE